LTAAICSDYERLLKESQRGLVAWRERSEEVSRFRAPGKEHRRRTAKAAKAALRDGRIAGWSSMERPASFANSRLVWEEANPPASVFIFAADESFPRDSSCGGRAYLRWRAGFAGGREPAAARDSKRAGPKLRRANPPLFLRPSPSGSLSGLY